MSVADQREAAREQGGQSYHVHGVHIVVWLRLYHRKVHKNGDTTKIDRDLKFPETVAAGFECKLETRLQLKSTLAHKWSEPRASSNPPWIEFV